MLIYLIFFVPFKTQILCHIIPKMTKVEMKKTEEYVIPKELEAKFEEMPQLESSFYKLTPGRQHQYIYHIGQAKRSETRQKRVEKYINQILEGKGMHDK